MFTPPFCPNPLCAHHRTAAAVGRWYCCNGKYPTKAFGTVQRFKCLSCNRNFSQQTFQLDYFVKKPLDYRKIFQHICSGSGIRSTARWLNSSHRAVSNRIGRLARQGLAVQAQLTEQLPLREDLVTDGFESFVVDQYQPNNIHLLVGSWSQFLYAFDYAHLRRKGRMTEAQRRKRLKQEQRYIRQRISISHSFRFIIDEVEQLVRRKAIAHITLFSDKKQEYRRMIKGSAVLQHLHRQGCFTHVTISSRKARTTANPLFAVNYLDRQLRKDNANQVRETVQFSRSVNNCLERLAVYQLYHNYFKPFRVEDRLGRWLRHGQVAGIERQNIDGALEQIFQRRVFFSHVRLSFSQLMVWARMVGSLHRRDGQFWPRYVWM